MKVWDGWSYASKLHRAHCLRRILIFLKSWTKIWDGTKCLKKEVVGVGEAWRGPAWSSRLAAQLMARRPFVCVPSRTSGQNLKCCPSAPTETRGAPAGRKAQNVSLCWNSRNTKQRIYILHKGFPGLNFTQGSSLMIHQPSLDECWDLCAFLEGFLWWVWSSPKNCSFLQIQNDHSQS